MRRACALTCAVLYAATGGLAWAEEAAPTSPGPADPVLVGAGGIASCDTPGDEGTAALIEALPDAAVFTAGDNAYEKGTAAQFAECYDPTWGKFKDRTHPAAGNHDYSTDSGGPYYEYFGDAAGEAGKGWYSYDLGEWHIVVLNSNCSGSKCASGSAQERWLKADLAASTARCTAAVIHHPLFSSDSVDGSQKEVRPLWEDLYAAGADLVIGGHARVYERFVPQTPRGVPDPDHGLTLINVGTGGRGHANFISEPLANSVARDRTSWGVLKLTLHAASFEYSFVPVAGATFTDGGAGECHDRPAPDGSEADTVGFSPEADSFVAKSSRWRNYGSKSSLQSDAEPERAAYLRFAVNGVEGVVSRARLRLWVTNGSGNGPAAYPTAVGFGPADPPWPESQITWNKRPDRTGPALDTLRSVQAGEFVELDVTEVVTGNGAYSFELAARSKDGAHFASSEASSINERPRLIIEVGLPRPSAAGQTTGPPAG